MQCSTHAKIKIGYNIFIGKSQGK